MQTELTTNKAACALHTLSLIILLVLLAYPPCPAATYTVDDDGPADYSKIQDAINVAVNGDTVQVMEGHYYENIDFRGKAITVTSNDPNDPDTVADTIIDANDDGIVVSFHMGEDPNSIITGFTITGGHDKYGAGICIWSGSSPKIISCNVVNNRAEDITGSMGAGIYATSGYISECLIKNNSVDDYGGGIFCIGNNIQIVRCNVKYNSTNNKGGGIFCGDYSTPLISQTIIANNTAGEKGGGIYSDRSIAMLIDSTIKNNLTFPNGGGGGIFIYDSDNFVIQSCNIIENHATWGGGIYSIGGNSLINDTNISNNVADDKGGGIYDDHSNPFLVKCVVNTNRATNGGAIYSGYGSNAVILNCDIKNNTASNYGGGICCKYECSTIVKYSSVIHNIANYGGGIYCEQNCAPSLRNILLCGNNAFMDGGGFYCIGSNPVISNSSICSNRAVINGGGIYSGENSDPIIKNNIICQNATSGIYAYYSNPIISYNNVWSNAINYDGWAWPGEGDISVDPKFIDPGYWDPNDTPSIPTDDIWVEGNYHLHHDSLCINAGDSAYTPEPGETDIDGEPRIRLGRVDMGADEAGSNPADFNENGVVDFVDYGMLSSAWLTEINDTGWNPICNSN